MKREELIDLLYFKENLALDKILDEINLEEDTGALFEVFKKTGKAYLIVDLVNYLTKSGNVRILEENIQYIPSKLWNHLKDNEEFKAAFINNFDKIAQNNDNIDFSDIKHVINKDEEEDFYKKNILDLIKIIKSEMGFFINHLINETDFGEDLLVENQVFLFGKLEYIWSLLDCLKYEFEIDSKIFLKGIVENFEYITQKEKFHFSQFLNIVKDMVEESNLEEKEIENIKEKIRETIVKNGKIDDELLEDIVRDNKPKILESIRYFGTDKEILKNEQDMFLNTFTGQKIIDYINGCKEYEGIPKDYTIKKLIQQVFYCDSVIANDPPTMNAIEILITEIAKAQGLESLDVENAGKGAYSTNFKIGDFILKIGDIRETRRIPYHKRIMQPIIRQETNPGNRNNLCVELQNVGDPNWYDNMSEEEIKEELYKIYSELRDDRYLLDRCEKRKCSKIIKT